MLSLLGCFFMGVVIFAAALVCCAGVVLAIEFIGWLMGKLPGWLNNILSKLAFVAAALVLIAWATAIGCVILHPTHGSSSTPTTTGTVRQ